MKYLFKFLPALQAKIQAAPGCILFLDFDGTLSALAATPGRAVLLKKNRPLLRQLKRHWPVAVISGRSLADIKRKVGLAGLIYAGNHGLEWEINGQRGKIQIPKKIRSALASLKKPLANLCKKYSGALLEQKGLGLAVHYRRTSPRLAAKLIRQTRLMLAPFKKKRLLKVTNSQKTFDIRPTVAWDKGECVKFLRRRLGKKLLPIYLGDDLTDEDAFKILPTGITIKVGRGQKSRARYYCRDINEASLFLRIFFRQPAKHQSRHARARGRDGEHHIS